MLGARPFIDHIGAAPCVDIAMAAVLANTPGDGAVAAADGAMTALQAVSTVFARTCGDGATAAGDETMDALHAIAAGDDTMGDDMHAAALGGGAMDALHAIAAGDTAAGGLATTPGYATATPLIVAEEMSAV